MISVTVQIPPALLAQLDANKATAALRASTLAVGEVLRGEMSKTPPAVHRPVIWASTKQKRFYFAMRRAMGLPPGYTRESDPTSQRLLRSWVALNTGVADAIVRSRGVTYASYVQADPGQTAQHKATGWTTDVQAVSTVQRSGQIERITDMTVKRIMGI